MEIGSSHSGDRHPNIQLHTAELIKYRDERKSVRFVLVGGETLQGVIRWFDDYVVHIADSERNEITLFKHAIVHYTTV